MAGFLEQQSIFQITTDGVANFAEAIIARDYANAHAMLDPNLQLELPIAALQTMIENRCQTKAAQYGYVDTHHPIDFMVQTTEAESSKLETVILEFYPSANLDFELFFALRLMVCTLPNSFQIVHLELTESRGGDPCLEI